MLLIIGATGTVGSALVTQLVEASVPVRALTRSPEKGALLPRGVQVCLGDLTDQASLAEAMTGVDRCFLITGDTRQDANAISAAKAAGVRHIVKLSTQEAGWTPVEGHGHWHKEREELIRASELAWTFLRPTMFMNFALAWIGDIQQYGEIRVGGGDGRLAPVDPRDVAMMAKAALTEPGHENRSYELTGPELLSFSDMANELSRALARPVRHADISEAETRERLAEMGMPAYVANGLAETFSLIRAGRFAYRTPDIEEVTGCLPRTFGTWVAEHLTAFAAGSRDRARRRS